MNVDSNELIEFFKGLYTEEQRADETKAEIREDLKSYSKENEISPKVINQLYALFKKYASGKQTAEESSDYNNLASVVIDYFEGV